MIINLKSAFHKGKAIAQIAAIEVQVNNLIQIGPPEAVLPDNIFQNNLCNYKRPYTVFLFVFVGVLKTKVF
jgi:hypothetical protein